MMLMMAGEAMSHAVTCLDVDVLTMLVDSGHAKTCINTTFKELMDRQALWKTPEGLSCIQILLTNGASGELVNAALPPVVESLCVEDTDLLGSILDLFVTYSSDINQNRGQVLKQATMNANLSAISRLLTRRTTDTKSIALPYLFSTPQDINAVMQILEAFAESIPDDKRVQLANFEHPDPELEPVLFMALSRYPRNLELLQMLLDIGYSPNQWKLHKAGASDTPEPWSILCWSLGQAEAKVSDACIEMLIDHGDKLLVETALLFHTNYSQRILTSLHNHDQPPYCLLYEMTKLQLHVNSSLSAPQFR
jgi:hypothetical protein